MFIFDNFLNIVCGFLQDLESEKVKTHLTVLAKRLKKACLMINPPTFERPSKQILPFGELQAIVEKEHKKLLARKVLIERRKEEQERQMLEMVCIFTCSLCNWQYLHQVDWFLK
jgi:translation initiation factor 3 subunit A